MITQSGPKTAIKKVIIDVGASSIITVIMGNMQKYCLVKLLEKLDEGAEFTAINYWPLHITLASNFIVDWESTDLFNKLSDVLSNINPVSVSAGEDEFFGGERKIQVTVLDMNEELMSLHKQIIKTLKEAGAIFDEPQYNENGYRAHATAQKSHRLNKGDNVLIDEVTIVDMFPNQDITRRKILKTIRLTSS